MTIIIRKATPAQNKLPVRNHTTMATIAGGKMRKMTLMTNTSMKMPMIRRTSKTMMSNNGGKPEGRGIGGAKGHKHLQIVFCVATALKP